MQTALGYAYDSHISYNDHLRMVDAARKGGAVAADAMDRAAGRLEAGISAAASQVTGALGDVSSAIDGLAADVREGNRIMEWGFSSMLGEMASMNMTLQALLKCARTPSQTWAYEQFDIARDNFRKGNYEDCLKRLDYAIDGYQTNLGYPEGWQLHQLKGDIYLQCPERDLIDLPKAENCFLAAAKYADTSGEKAMALTAAAVAAYNQGHMEVAEKYARQACEAERKLAEAHFQLARIRLNGHNYNGAWQDALQAMTLDHKYAACLPLDSEFQRNAGGMNPLWQQYADSLRTSVEATVQSAAATMQELAKSREETKRVSESDVKESLHLLGMSHIIELLDLAALAEAKVRFQRMSQLVEELTPEAEKSLKSLCDSLRQGSVFALLEAEPEAQRANDLATGTLAASREAEFTVQKVGKLSHAMPSLPASYFEIVFLLLVSLIGGLILSIIANAILFIVVLIIIKIVLICFNISEGSTPPDFVVYVCLFALFTGTIAFFWLLFRDMRRDARKEAAKKGIENFDWSSAHAPQTTAKPTAP